MQHNKFQLKIIQKEKLNKTLEQSNVRESFDWNKWEGRINDK